MPIDLGINPLFNFESKKVLLEKIESIDLTLAKDKVDESNLKNYSNWSVNSLRNIGLVVISISLLLFIRFIYRFGSIIFIHTSGKKVKSKEGLNLIFTDKTDNAFSFLRYIFINPLKFSDEEKRLIIEHECEHIRHFHSIDLMLVELLIVLQWFNPFAYIARRKLIELHEFIADNGVIRNGADPYSYQNLLLSVVTSSCLPSAGNQLSAFITKKRIAMIGKPMNQTGRWINFLILVPIAVILIIGISAFSPKESIENEVTYKTPKSIISQNNNLSGKEELMARVRKELKDVNLKDFYINVLPKGSNTIMSPDNYSSYSVILKKDCIFNLYFFSGSKEDKLVAKIESGKPEELVLEKEFNFSYSSKTTFVPKQTGAYRLSVSNLSSKRADALMVVTLNESILSQNKDNQDLQKVDTLKKKIASQNDEGVFLVVEQMPSFGTEDANGFRAWIAANLKYPKEAADKGIQGRVFVQYIIEKDGSITNVKVIRSANSILDKEAIRVVESSPKWNPGKQKGKPVRVSFTFPITFTLN
jgi:TonB family protein